MTTACLVVLTISLVLYLSATLLLQGHFLFRKSHWSAWGRNALALGVGVHVMGLILHFAFSRLSPITNLIFLLSLFIIAFLIAGLLLEGRTGARYLSLLLAPLAFLVLLYPMLMPVRFDDAESMLVRFPWLGVHLVVTLIGHVGFALAFGAAVIYLVQTRLLKKGRLNRYLPSLDSSSHVTLFATGIGFSFFSLGLAMGIIWLFGAPGEYLGARDVKIWMALPTWLTYAGYLYLRGIRHQQSSRLTWLVIAGFVLAVVNLLGVRHNFESPTASIPSLVSHTTRDHSPRNGPHHLWGCSIAT